MADLAHEPFKTFFIDEIVKACKNRQYEYAEAKLPHALNDAKDSQVLDPRLASVVYGLAGFYASKGDNTAAKILYRKLVRIEKAMPYVIDCEFEKLAAKLLIQERNKAPIISRIGNMLKKMFTAHRQHLAA